MTGEGTGTRRCNDFHGAWFSRLVPLLKHPLARRRSAPLKLIAREPLVTHEKGHPIRNQIEKKFIEKGLPFHAILEVEGHFGSRDAIRRAVASGLGIGFLSKGLVEWDVEARRLKVLKTPGLNVKTTLYIVAHKNRYGSALTRTFVDFLKRHRGIL